VSALEPAPRSRAASREADIPAEYAEAAKAAQAAKDAADAQAAKVAQDARDAESAKTQPLMAEGLDLNGPPRRFPARLTPE